MIIFRIASKRFVDIFASAIALVILLPLMAIIAVLIQRKLGSPVLFRQSRPGQDERIFTIYKFRTMVDIRDSDGRLLPDELRIPPFGQFLRRSSLDELPELVNVLLGQMSLVGPRPLLVEYLDRYSTVHRRRHEVKPGITGWAQVNGRNILSWEEKFDLDIWYVDNYSLRTDLKIIVMTVSQVIKREGISQTGYATAQEFKGKETS